MGTWLNSDGLYIKYGPDEGEAGIAGEFGTMANGSEHVISVKIDLTTLGTAAAIVSDNVIVPKDYEVRKVVVYVSEAAAGATADLNVGLIRLDRSTEIDYQAFVKAADVATLTDGATLELIKGATAAGDLVGTVTSATYPGYITADYDTAAFTDGTVTVDIYLRKV